MNTLINDFSYGLFFWQLLILTIIPFTGLWIYCLIDLVRNKFEENDKIIWVLILMFIPFIGSILYLFIGRKKKLKLN